MIRTHTVLHGIIHLYGTHKLKGETVYSTGNLNSDEVISLKVSVFPKDVNEALNFYSLVAVNMTSLL